MASEYSVNIKLNTAQVKKDLKTIGDGINNLGKKQAKGSKAALSDAEKQLKLENTSLALKNRALGLSLKALPLQLKGVKLDEVALKLQQATADAEKFEFDLAKNSLLLADKDIKKAQIRFKAQNDINKATVKTVKVEDTVNKQLRERTKTLGQIVKLRNLGSSAGRLAGRFEFEEALQTRGPGGRMLALPSSEMLEQRVRSAGQVGGFSRALSTPNFMQRIGATRGFDAQSALISGGFPLLFGQGPITAAAGAVGGGVGGMFGQMGGFAGGIAATAAVQSISNTLNSVRELGNALRKPTENLQLLTEKLSLNNTPTGDLIAKLEKLGMTSTAASILIEEFAERTGKTPEEVKAATKELEEFNKGMADLGLKIGFIVSDVLGPAITLLNKLPLEGIAKFFMGRGFGFLNPGGALSPFKESLPQKKLRIEKSRGSGVGNNLPSSLQNVEAMANEARAAREILPLRQALEIEKQRFTVNSKILGTTKEKNKLDSKIAELEILKKEATKQTNDSLDFKIEKLKAEVALQQQIFENAQTLADPIKAQTIQLDQQMKVLMDRGSQIVALSQAISSSFEQSFTGIINGTMSVKDAFRNMLNSIANHFINTAAKMMANQLQRGLLGILGNAFGSAFSSGSSFKNFGSTSVGTASQFVGSVKGFPTFADGGRPPVGRASIVGERGPELFVPDRAGTIVPNNAMGGSTNIVINVDASGSSVEGDEEQANQFGSAIATAIQSELIKQKRPGGLLA